MAVSDAQPISAANLKAVLNRGGGGAAVSTNTDAIAELGALASDTQTAAAELGVEVSDLANC